MLRGRHVLGAVQHERAAESCRRVPGTASTSSLPDAAAARRRVDGEQAQFHFVRLGPFHPRRRRVGDERARAEHRTVRIDRDEHFGVLRRAPRRRGSPRRSRRRGDRRAARGTPRPSTCRPVRTRRAGRPDDDAGHRSSSSRLSRLPPSETPASSAACRNSVSTPSASRALYTSSCDAQRPPPA